MQTAALPLPPPSPEPGGTRLCTRTLNPWGRWYSRSMTRNAREIVSSWFQSMPGQSPSTTHSRSFRGVTRISSPKSMVWKTVRNRWY
ncbi:MAG: hypothetical protein RB296_02470 [Acidobacteriota bacterium]|nr:hypothetical protein [Acidobacteriota bacterium]